MTHKQSKIAAVCNCSRDGAGKGCTLLLENLNHIRDIKKFDHKELKELAAEIRKLIIEVVSTNGGHLASSLGVVELTIALHYVFNTPNDRIIWDVGHQAYAHKILTGRKDLFATLRTCGGISGFPKISESPFDAYNVGHSSTSLSLAMGEACARDINREKYHIIPVIGDGSMTGGMAFEALNHIGHLKKDVIIVLNDNEHSISKNVGALSEYFTSLISGKYYNKSRRFISKTLEKMPFMGPGLESLVDKTKKNIKGLIIPGRLFEDLGLRYFGPVDGHNLNHLVDLFKKVSTINSGPKIIHIYTKKGKGYDQAEANPKKFHGIGPFDIKSGSLKSPKKPGFSDVVGTVLCQLAKSNEKITALTAAMTSGTGLEEFSRFYPDRFFDVGIAEQHGVTFAAALAKNGCSPFFAVYSTFLQRAYDQLVHDVGAMSLPVTVLIDRSGIVGEDGETHHGLLDISFLKSIPNFQVLTPENEYELASMLAFAASYSDGPLAIKYPRLSISQDVIPEFDLSCKHNYSFRQYGDGDNICIITYGYLGVRARKISEYLEKRGITSRAIVFQRIKPIEAEGLNRHIDECRYFITIEDNYLKGGFNEIVLTEIDRELVSKNLYSYGYPDEYICHGKVDEIREIYGLLPEQISDKTAELYEKSTTR